MRLFSSNNTVLSFLQTNRTCVPTLMILNKVVRRHSQYAPVACANTRDGYEYALRANKRTRSVCKQLDSKRRLDSKKAVRLRKSVSALLSHLRTKKQGVDAHCNYCTYSSVFAIRPTMRRDVCVNKYNGKITTKNEEQI